VLKNYILKEFLMVLKNCLISNLLGGNDGENKGKNQVISRMLAFIDEQLSISLYWACSTMFLPIFLKSAL
jgi:hypothetical protein